MKNLHLIRKRLAQAAAFTLAEMGITTAIFTLVMGSMLTLYVYSARSTSGVMRQLELDSQSRVLNQILKEIKSSSAVDIQTYNGTTFSSISAGQAQQGNALSVTVSNQQVLYWVDSSGGLYRSIVGSNSSKRWMTNVTNSNPFVSKDYSGAVLSNDAARTLIDITFQALDTNVKNFRQSITLKTAVAKRN